MLAVMGDFDPIVYRRRRSKLPPFEAELLEEAIHERSKPYVRDPDPYASDTPSYLRTPATPSSTLGGELEGFGEVEDLADLVGRAPPWVAFARPISEDETKPVTRPSNPAWSPK